MADNFQKTPLTQSVNAAAMNRAGDATQAQGKSLPCTVVKVVSSGIVTVAFQVQGNQTLANVTMPVTWSEFTRIPVYVGMKGVARTADARLGGVSGLGGGVADFTLPGNLGALTFEPIGNTQWSVVDGDTLVFIGGPNGIKIQDATNPAASVSCKDGTVTITGTLIINGTPFLEYRATEVQTGSGISGPLTP